MDGGTCIGTRGSENPTGKSALRLSIHDLAGVGVGTSISQALAGSTAQAVLADKLGYHRYWVAEHHGTPSVASSAPIVVLTHLAANTSAIRIGSGGVMLPNHAPLVVAEQFGTLDALHPSRIDLGLGRAPGTDKRTAHALRRRTEAEGGDDFPDQIAELQHFMHGDFPADHPYSKIQATPMSPVPVYILGSSEYGARLAARLGLPFAFAYHFAGVANSTENALEVYRSQFRPSAQLDQPYVLIGVLAVAADSAEEAEFQAKAGALSMMLQRSGRRRPVPTPEQAAAFVYSPEDQELITAVRATEINGTADHVAAGLAALADRFGVQELLISTRCHAVETKLHSLELIAAAAGLPARVT
jgi:luciferase family oxidoreductase group 1